MGTNSQHEEIGDDEDLVLKYISTGEKEKTIFQFQQNGHTQFFVVTPVSNHCAYVTGFDLTKGEEIHLSEEYRLKGDEGGLARMVKGVFILAWFDSYSLYFADREVLRFECQRQQLGKRRTGVSVAKRQKIDSSSGN